MMIRINLLPVRRVLKQRQGQRALAAYVAAIAVALMANVFWYLQKDKKLQETRDKIAETQKRIEDIERDIGDIANFKRKEKEVNDKLSVLETLKRGRLGPVKMLDALSSAIPKRVVLKGFVEQSNLVNIAGEAFSHEDVAEFMSMLANMVWTPRGLGTRSKETNSVRLMSDGSAVPFQSHEIVHLFTDVLPVKSESIESPSSGVRQKQVNFELRLSANYAL